MSPPKVYLITGCSSGLGLSLARAVLKAGHKVIATSRNPSKNPDLVSEIKSQGGEWLPLDPTSADADAQFEAAVKIYGTIDCLINNAGVGIGGALEDGTMDEVRDVMEINFFGLVRLTKLALPHMREHGSGTIVNVSSSVVAENLPGLSLYTASKWAVEGFSESLAGEVAPFGIRVLIVEPGAMRTAFVTQGAGNNARFVPVSETYQNSPVAMVYQGLQAMDGTQAIDPAKAGDMIVHAVEGTGDFLKQGKMGDILRLPIGQPTGDTRRGWLQKEMDMLERTEETWSSTHFPTEE